MTVTVTPGRRRAVRVVNEGPGPGARQIIISDFPRGPHHVKFKLPVARVSGSAPGSETRHGDSDGGGPAQFRVKSQFRVVKSQFRVEAAVSSSIWNSVTVTVAQ